MNKRMKRIGICLSLCLIMLLGVTGTAFAYYDETEAVDDGAVVVIEENIPEEEPAPETVAVAETEPQETSTSDGVLTPDGNLTLVDDLTQDAVSGLQFMTVTTKNGSYFYIIIDRSGKEENVYFLNTVDAADLMALMTDDEKAQFKEDTTTEVQPSPVIDINDGTGTEKEPEVTTEPEKNSGSSLALLGVFAGLGALAAGGYYMLKIKPQKGQTDIDVDREFYDDEDYVNEDEEPEFADLPDEY